jgi:hypothetical protein
MSALIFDQPRTFTWPGASRIAQPGLPSPSARVAGVHQAPAPTRIAAGTYPPAPRTGAATMHTSAIVACSYDARLAAILDAELLPGEPALVGFARKERELGEAFAALPVMDQRALHARLGVIRPGDMLAAKFARLTSDRRARLVAFLGDARRRAAVATAKTGVKR